MKPWRPFWLGLERAIERIHDNKGFDIDPSIPLSEWIQELNFLQLAVANDECRCIATWLCEEKNEFAMSFAGEDHRFQLYLRCLRGLDFCRGRVGKRKEFDWEIEPIEIYKKLLTDDWMSGALHWIARCHPAEIDETKRTLRQLSPHPDTIHKN